MKGVNIFLANGFEDIEALATIDVLRRGGVNVCVSGISDAPFVNSSHGVVFGLECNLDDLDQAAEGTVDSDVMIFPGGMPGAKNLGQCRKLMDIMREHYAAGGTVAAICAAPGLVLRNLDGIAGTEFTCYDGFEQDLVDKGAIFTPVPAVTSGRVITGRGPGYAVDFGLEILRKLKGSEIADEVRAGMYLV